MKNELLERIILGPFPPVGRPYRPRPSLRCLVGLHRWSEVWEFTQTSTSTNGGRWTVEASVNLDREPDYIACVRCPARRNRVPIPEVN